MRKLAIWLLAAPSLAWSWHLSPLHATPSLQRQSRSTVRLSDFEDEEEDAEMAAALERYKAAGLFDSFDKPRSRSLFDVEKMWKSESEEQAELQSALEEDEDDEMSTEEALALSKKRLDDLMRRVDDGDLELDK